jgi:hypothetical protein
MSGWQAKLATTNGVFEAKIPQINIVKSRLFFYYFGTLVSINFHRWSN